MLGLGRFIYPSNLMVTVLGCGGLGLDLLGLNGFGTLFFEARCLLLKARLQAWQGTKTASFPPKCCLVCLEDWSVEMN